MSNHYTKLTNLFKQAFIKNSSSIFFKITSPETALMEQILVILLKKGLILGYKWIPNNLQTKLNGFEILFKKNLNGRNLISDVNDYSTFLKVKHCTSNELLKYQSLNKLVLVSTSSGLLDLEEAVRLKLGGRLLLSFEYC